MSTLRPKLTQDPTHQAAVLRWIVLGAFRYLNYGLGTPPEAVFAATKEYRDDQDVLGPFLEQAWNLDPDTERTCEHGQNKSLGVEMIERLRSAQT